MPGGTSAATVTSNLPNLRCSVRLKQARRRSLQGSRNTAVAENQLIDFVRQFSFADANWERAGRLADSSREGRQLDRRQLAKRQRRRGYRTEYCEAGEDRFFMSHALLDQWLKTNSLLLINAHTRSSYASRRFAFLRSM